MKRALSRKKTAIAGRKWRAKKSLKDARLAEARRVPVSRAEVLEVIPPDWKPPAGCMTYDIGMLRRKWLPRPKMKTLEWLEQNAVVPGGVGSDFKGKFNISYFPYQAGVLELFDDPEVREIYLQWGTQLGKTFLLQMLVPKIADTDPAPILFGAADADLAGDVGGRIYKIVEQVESLKGILPPEARRDMYKIGLGDCIVHMAWSGSPASLGDKSCRYVFCIELSKWNLKKSQEADPADLVRERVKMFFNTKIIMEGTPTVEGSCRMDALGRNANQRMVYHVPCPYCGEYQTLSFKSGVEWEKTKDKKNNRDIAQRSTWYNCRACKKHIGSSEKLGMMRRGVWAEGDARIPKDFVGKVFFTPGKYKARVHLQLSSLYSPLLTWGDCASEFIRCTDKQKGNIGLQNFINSWLAETWTQKIREFHWEDLKKKISVQVPQGFVPEWVKIITAGVDIQKGWGVYVIRGWGKGNRSRLIEWGQIVQLAELEKIIVDRKFKISGSSNSMGIMLCGIDTGYMPYDIYLWSKQINEQYGESIRCCKGGGHGAPYYMTQVERSGIDSKPIPGGVGLWNMNDHHWKSFLVGKYDIPQGRPGAWEVPSDADEIYMRSITAEVMQQVQNKRTGEMKYEWVIVDTTVGNHYFDAEKIAACMADMCDLGEIEDNVRPVTRPNSGQEREEDGFAGDFLAGSGDFWGDK